ncbi:hypothetical protein Ahy_A03g016905 [Arachis hypogaea]|uniref:Uncharacterized protein n=1 Tax=Arachis hypogaea TaxID=3818 RepID=A0A445E4N9_ARAHY|nr:hypothetical protein Ahy_A03g016905 [Arachis hypogaea]
MTDEELQTFCLIEIEKLLQANEKSLRDFAGMPLPNVDLVSQFSNSMVLRELEYDISMMLEEHDSKFSNLNEEQSQSIIELYIVLLTRNMGCFSFMSLVGLEKLFCIDSYLPNCILKEELLLMLVQVELLHYCYLVVRQLILCLVSHLN